MAWNLSFMKNYMTNFRQIVLTFTARFFGVFADVEATGDNNGKQ